MAMKFEEFMGAQGIDKSLTVKAQRLLKNSEFKNNIKTTFSGAVMIDGDFDKMGDYVKAAFQEELKEKEEENEKKQRQAEKSDVGIVYSLEGNRGRSMKVFPDRCVITVSGTVGALLTGNITDGEKTIFYHDVIGIQFKYPGAIIGYLQMETASGLMNNSSNNMFNENTFTFEDSGMSSLMTEVKNYITERVALYKKVPFSVPDEILKYQKLLEQNVITQEEFDKKKEELLSLPG